MCELSVRREVQYLMGNGLGKVGVDEREGYIYNRKDKKENYLIKIQK